MRASLPVIFFLLPLVGCASIDQGHPAALCNTPGRKDLTQAITDRGGKITAEEMNGWDDSVELATKERMGPPLAEVVMPQDKFSDQEIRTATAVFPEAKVIAPPTMDDFDDDPDSYRNPSSGIPLNLPAQE